MNRRWDAVIAGAGPAGAVTAHQLARAGRAVLLVDEIQAGARKVGESLPGSARPLLRDMGLLPVVEAGPHWPCFGNVSAWGSNRLANTDFIRDPHGPGWRLDRPRFDADLRAAALGAGASMAAARVRRFSPDRLGWRVDLGRHTIFCRWLVDATGRRAALARNLKVERWRDDSLVALFAWVPSSECDDDTRTLVESAPDGWWYTARLPDRTRVVALHLDSGEAASILRAPGAWQQRLIETRHVRRAIKGVLETRARGNPLDRDPPASLEAPRGGEACGARLERFAGKGWLATGDAALSFDPLSSQGIFNALYTGMKAAQAIDHALSGRSEAIESYTSRLLQIRGAYLSRRHLVYQSELRWPDRPFWARRLFPDGAEGGAGVSRGAWKQDL